MEAIEIGLDNLEPISIQMDDGSNKKPSVNFGPGIELLMNDKKRSSSSSVNVDLGELDELESELNELTGNKPTSSNNKSSDNSGTTKTLSGFADNLFNFSGMNNPFSSASSTEKAINIDVSSDMNDSNLGQATMDSIGSTKTWDGFSKINEIPGSGTSGPKMTDREKRRKKRAMLKKLDEWYEKGHVKNMTHMNMDTAYEEVEDEYETVMEDKRKKDSIKLQGWWFMTFINSVEYANTVFNPFDLNLDGWGEQVSEDIDSYDEIFSELHEKYKGGKLSPEISLLLRLGFSAAVVNITNKALSTATPGFNDVIRHSPELMRMFTNATVQSMSQQSPGFGFANNMVNPNEQVNTTRGPPPAPVETKNQSRAGSQMNFTDTPSNRPDISLGRGGSTMFREQGVDLTDNYENLMRQDRSVRHPAPPMAETSNFTQGARPEMRGPQNLDLNSMLSGLKPTMSAPPPPSQADDGGDSMISVSSLRDLQNSSMPKRTNRQRKPKSERNTISLDI